MNTFAFTWCLDSQGSTLLSTCIQWMMQVMDTWFEGRGGGILGDFRELQEISGDFRRFNRIWGILERITPPADHGVTYPESCPEEWFLRGWCGVWHSKTMRVSVSWLLPEKIPVGRQASWTCHIVVLHIGYLSQQLPGRLIPAGISLTTVRIDLSKSDNL